MEHHAQDNEQVYARSARTCGRMVLSNEGQHESRWSAILSISAKIDCVPQTLNEWVKRAEVDSGRRGGLPSAPIHHGVRIGRSAMRNSSPRSRYCNLMSGNFVGDFVGPGGAFPGRGDPNWYSMELKNQPWRTENGQQRDTGV